MDIKKIWIALTALMLLLSACASPSAESALLTASAPHYVTAPPDATATPTPFQPSVLSDQTTPTATALIPDSASTLSATLAINPASPPTLISQEEINSEQAIVFALLGSDSRGSAYFRTDTIVIAAVWPKLGQVSMISIPRDLYVSINIPQVDMAKVNTAYMYGLLHNYPGGGEQLFKDTLLNNLGIRVDHIAILDFEGFRRIVDTLGGLDLPVACPYTDWRLLAPNLNIEDENNWALYTVEPGVVRMDGDLALWYARSRKKSSDFDRARRQQEVIRAMYASALRSDTLRSLPQLYADFRATVTTDLALTDLLALAPISLHLSNADIRSYYIASPLVSSWITPGGAYVLIPDQAAISAMLQTALRPSAQRVQTTETLKVEVQNGSPFNGWDTLAAERLNYAGYETSLTQADNRNYATSLFYDMTPEQNLQKRATLLALLGLQESQVVSVPGWDYPAQYVFIAGSDFKPCFDPKNISP